MLRLGSGFDLVQILSLKITCGSCDMEIKNVNSVFADIVWTLLAVLIVPTAAFWIVGNVWFIDRAIVNVDYLIVCLFLIYFGAAPVLAAIAIVMVLDLVFSLAPAYHFSLVTVLDSVRDILDLEPGFLIIETFKVMTLIFTCTVLIYVPLKKIQSAKSAVATCLLFVIVISILDIELSANSLADSDSYTINANIAASSLNNLRLALSTSKLDSIEQIVRPAQSASEVLRDPYPWAGSRFPTIILIVVESLGQFNDPKLNQFQLAPIMALDSEADVKLQQGVVEFEGSTVPGELRELCGVKLLAVHPNSALLPTNTCLPQLFNEEGYETIAIHGFIGTLFSRSRWYPILKFEQIWFAPKLDELIVNAKRCGIAFHGICDEDIWGLIVRQHLTINVRPKFIYWLTLSAHLPVEHPNGNSNANCSEFEVLDQEPELCNLVVQQRKLFTEIAASIRKHELGGTRILMVGDHAPPFLKNEIRALFNPRNVPYINIQIPTFVNESN